MSTVTSPSKAALWIGYIMGILPTLMMLLSAFFKFSPSPEAAKGFEHLGVPMTQSHALGVVELSCLVLFWFPRTSVLGAILLTGYLGGATSIHVRVGDPFFMTPLFGVFFWGSLYLRDPRLRALIPFRS